MQWGSVYLQIFGIMIISFLMDDLQTATQYACRILKYLAVVYFPIVYLTGSQGCGLLTPSNDVTSTSGQHFPEL